MLIPNAETMNIVQTLLDSRHNSVIIVDVDCSVITVNKVFERVYGRADIELISCSIQQTSIYTNLCKVLGTGEPIIGQEALIDGRSYILNCTPIIHDEVLVGAIAELQDVSELQSLKEELEINSRLVKLFKAVLESDYECVVAVDQNARIIMINRAYCNLLGVKKEDALGRKVQDVIDNTRLHIVLQTGHPEIGEIQRIKGKDTITSRIPLKFNGKVRAAVGKVMFTDVSELRSLMKRVDRLQSELDFYKEELKRYQGTRYFLDDIIGNSPQLKNLKELVFRVAKNDSTVLIRGESGTGKELFAHAIHNASPRAHRPFVKVNCAALPENLLESELFGYQEGAFTGARKGGKIGKFELADKGTIFLDEIGDMSINMQVKLLRVLQEKEIERLGDNRPTKVDVRVVAATNRNLEEMVAQGQFRGDLFYRLNVVMLDIPPLRQRLEDIPTLTDSLMKKLSWQLGCPAKILDQSAINSLLAYSWPGNVRELENVLERLLNMVEDEVITVSHLTPYLHKDKVLFIAKGMRPLKEAVELLESTLITNSLEATAGDCLAAARLLRVSKSTFYEKMSKYGISKKFNN